MKNNNFVPKIVAGLLVASLGAMTVFSATINTMSDTMSSVKVDQPSNHTLTFVTPTGVATGTTIVLTFPGEFEMPLGFSFSDVDINIGGPTTASATLASTATGTAWGVSRTSSTTLTITNATGTPVAPGSSIYIRLGTNAIWQSVGTNQMTNDITTGNRLIGITGSFGDYGTTTVHLLTDDNVLINAVVNQAFTFSISSNTINFGDLNYVSAKYASSSNPAGDAVDTVAHTLNISSNANSGYTITVMGQTLTSQQHSQDTITQTGSTAAVSAPGTEQFGIYATVSGGTGPVIDPTYATPSSFGYDATATTSAIFASDPSSSVPTIYSLHYLANITSLTEAGNYSANIIYVGTANF